MANAKYYIDSGAGGSNSGTFANPYNTATGIRDAITASGSTGTDFYVASRHVEGNSGAAVTLTFKGVAATPDRLFTCNASTWADAPTTAELQTMAASTGQIATTGTFAVTVNGNVYIYGVTINDSTGTAAAPPLIGTTAGSDITFDTCIINNKQITNASAMTLGAAGGSRITLINTSVTLAGNASSTINIAGGTVIWKNTTGPAISNANASLSNGISSTATRNWTLICDGVDFSGTNGIASGKNIVQGLGVIANVQFINCKATSGAVWAGTPTVPGPVIDVVISDSAAHNYNQQHITYQGALTTSTAVYNASSDGDTPISWLVTTASAAGYPNAQAPFECPTITKWVPTRTYTVSRIQITSATAALTNADVWVDVEFLGNSSSYPLASKVTSGNSPQLPQGTSPGSLSAGTWTSTGTGSAGHDYYLAIPSFQTYVDGYIRCTVKVGNFTAGTSYTVYIDPFVTVA